MAEFTLSEDPFDAEERVQTSTIPRNAVVAGRTDLSLWQEEFDGYWAGMRQFELMDPTEIFLRLSGFSARASELRALIGRTENRRWNAFRTKEIEPFLEEVDRQFKFHSRVAAMREFEFRLSGGSP